MSNKTLKVVWLSVLMVSLFSCTKKADDSVTDPQAKTEIVVYSARKEHLIKPVFDYYTKKTGIPIKYITDKPGPLIVRLQSEGATTPADILLTTDIGFLWRAQEMNLLQPFNSKVLKKNIPSYLRDSKNRWFAITLRSRTIVYASDRINADELSTYEALSQEKFKGRLCLRTSKKSYNQSLVASLIAHDGEKKTQQIIDGWVQNLAIAPFSDDTSTMMAVLAGQCDITLVNSYYFGKLQQQDKEGSLKIFWPNQKTVGAHMNISGLGLTQHAKQPKLAKDFIEWLSGKEAQTLLVELNLEFPVNQSVEPVLQVKQWGEFKQDHLPMNIIAEHQRQAVKVIDKAGYR